MGVPRGMRGGYPGGGAWYIDRVITLRRRAGVVGWRGERPQRLCCGNSYIGVVQVNCFIQPYVLGVKEQVTCPLVDPRSVREDRRRFRRDALPLLERANSFFCPSGHRACRGYVLLDRASYDKLDLYSTDFRLELGDPDSAGNVGALQGISIVSAQCATRGVAADPDAIYLVELTDARGLVDSPWFQFPTNSQYNIRAPAYSESGTTASKYYFSSIDLFGQPWTWEGVVGDLWGQMDGLLGAFPGLPSTPTGTPEGFAFPGCPAWRAVCRILDLLGMSVAADLTEDPPYSIVLDGEDGGELAGLQALYESNLEDDLEHIDTGAGRVPAQIVVYFHRRNQYYGTEETVRGDSKQWQSTPLYPVSVLAPAQFSGASGAGHLWSDFTVRHDVDGAPLAADVSTATTVAAALAARYYAKVYRGTAGAMCQRYAGALSFSTGGLVDEVEWRQDYQYGRAGWCTSVRRGVTLYG